MCATLLVEDAVKKEAIAFVKKESSTRLTCEDNIDLLLLRAKWRNEDRKKSKVQGSAGLAHLRGRKY